MSVGNSNVQITTTENGWIFSKGNGDKKTEIQFVDENKNGTIDNNDKKIVISLGAGDFTIEEFNAAKESIAERLSATKKEETVGDWYNRKATEEQEEARAEAFERQQQLRKRQQLELYNQQLDNNGKKGNFWNKAAMFLGALCGFGGGFFSNGWSYNSGSLNDWNVRLFSTGVNGLYNTSSLLNASYGNYNNAANFNYGLGGNGMFDAGFFNQMAAAQSDYMQQRQQQFDESMKAVTQAQEKSKAEAEAKAAAQLAEKMHTKYKDADDTEILNTNKTKIEEIYSPTKDDSAYTAEEKAILDKIAAYPQVPYDAVDDKGEGTNGKFSAKVAKAVNDLLTEYNGCATPEAKVNVMSKANYDKLKSYISAAQSGSLKEADLKTLGEILKNPKGE